MNPHDPEATDAPLRAENHTGRPGVPTGPHAAPGGRTAPLPGASEAHAPLSNTDLDEIEARAAALYEYATVTDEEGQVALHELTDKDVPALLAEIRRQRAELDQTRENLAFLERTTLPDLRREVQHHKDGKQRWRGRAEKAETRVAELEAYANGCDAEGCVIPHSSWCEAAKKTAADNDGCTCGQPWADHPQPHAMHCWTVNPPRAEVEEMRRALAAARATTLTEGADAITDMERRNAWPVRPVDAGICAEFLRGMAAGSGAAATDTLPAWLYQRFMAHGIGWDNLGDDDRAYWEHQAAAVRRAVARGGFKNPEASA